TGKVLSCGQVYPLLDTMQKKGLVTHIEERDGNRKRKVYSLTHDGTAFADDLKTKIVKLLGL
ncbi:MAG: PadR family transcriptional regulator, partial [Candidatus Aenigmarchaeota archaeon]|nr:PadR family transcriptional regulator [Candidatus Aenigmarchaeota archaeon]